jgi:AhpD family alkylhydroperoxidase
MTGKPKTAFRSLHDASLAAGTLDVRTRELIALACGVTRRCEGCIQHHVKAAVAAGATAAEIRETLDVCVLMGGGPAVTFSGKALELLRALTPS